MCSCFQDNSFNEWPLSIGLIVDILHFLILKQGQWIQFSLALPRITRPWVHFLVLLINDIMLKNKTKQEVQTNYSTLCCVSLIKTMTKNKIGEDHHREIRARTQVGVEAKIREDFCLLACSPCSIHFSSNPGPVLQGWSCPSGSEPSLLSTTNQDYALQTHLQASQQRPFLNGDSFFSCD